MKPLIIAASIFATTLTFAALPAMADTADAGTCRTLGQQVGTALNAATGDVSAARAEQRQGITACASGLYANGAGHYQKALGLIGK